MDLADLFLIGVRIVSAVLLLFIVVALLGAAGWIVMWGCVWNIIGG